MHLENVLNSIDLLVRVTDRCHNLVQMAVRAHPLLSEDDKQNYGSSVVFIDRDIRVNFELITSLLNQIEFSYSELSSLLSNTNHLNS